MGKELVVVLVTLFVAGCGGEVVETSSRTAVPPEVPAPPAPAQPEPAKHVVVVTPGSCGPKTNAEPALEGGTIEFNPEATIRMSYERIVAEDVAGIEEKPDTGELVFVRRLNLRFEGGPVVSDNPEGGVCVSTGSATWPIVVTESKTTPPDAIAAGEYAETTIYGSDFSSSCCETGRGGGVGGRMQITNAKVTITARTDSFVEGKIETRTDAGSAVRSELAKFRAPLTNPK